MSPGALPVLPGHRTGHRQAEHAAMVLILDADRAPQQIALDLTLPEQALREPGRPFEGIRRTGKVDAINIPNELRAVLKVEEVKGHWLQRSRGHLLLAK